MSDNSEEYEIDQSSYAKHGRFTCKSESHVKKSFVGDKANFLFEPHQSAQIQMTSRVRKESSSLPCSPNHVMPAKWRFKQRQREEKTDRSVTPTAIRNKVASASDVRPQAKRHSKSTSYGDTLFISRSQDRDVRAYQSSDQLIVITDEPGNDASMEVEESPSSPLSNTNKQVEFKRYKTLSDEIRDINEESCSSNDSVMLPDPNNDNVMLTSNNDDQNESSKSVVDSNVVAVKSRATPETGKVFGLYHCECNCLDRFRCRTLK